VASEADIALCLECARPGGEVVTRRKGGAIVEVALTGRAAHAGIEPEKGIHAGLAAAYATIALQALNDPAAGVTVNVGVLAAGRIPNAVPASARLIVDVRAWEAGRLDAAVAAVRTAVAELPVDGIEVEVALVERFAPMEHTPAADRLLASARGLAAGLGIDLRATATGGGGDANTLAGLGLPVLDGLGPVGGDYHAPTEWLDLTSVVPRTALLAALIATGGGADVRTGASAGPDGASG
jgi:glutamate carboxypeptidase